MIKKSGPEGPDVFLGGVLCWRGPQRGTSRVGILNSLKEDGNYESTQTRGG